MKIAHNTRAVPAVDQGCRPADHHDPVDHHDDRSRRGHDLLARPSVAGPYDIAAGPDGALWFTNYFGGSDRADHDRRDDHEPPQLEHQSPRRHRAGRRRRDVVREHARTTRSGASLPTATSPSRPTTTRGSRRPYRVAAGPGGVTWFTGSGSNSVGWVTASGVANVFYHYGHRRTRRASPPAPTAPCGSRTSTAARSGGSTAAGDVTLLRRPDRRRAAQHHDRSRRRVVVHESRQQLDRPDHDRRRRSPTSPTRRSRARSTSSTGSDGALWFTNYGNNTIGRITTDGDRHELLRPVDLRAPTASRPGPTARSGSRTPATTRSGGSACEDPLGRVRVGAGRSCGGRCVADGPSSAVVVVPVGTAGAAGGRRAVGRDRRHARGSRWAGATRACCRRTEPCSVGGSTLRAAGEQLAVEREGSGDRRRADRRHRDRGRHVPFVRVVGRRHGAVLGAQHARASWATTRSTNSKVPVAGREPDRRRPRSRPAPATRAR